MNVFYKSLDGWNDVAEAHGQRFKTSKRVGQIEFHDELMKQNEKEEVEEKNTHTHNWRKSSAYRQESG